jgi:hypothetical protein
VGKEEKGSLLVYVVIERFADEEAERRYRVSSGDIQLAVRAERMSFYSPPMYLIPSRLPDRPQHISDQPTPLFPALLLLSPLLFLPSFPDLVQLGSSISLFFFQRCELVVEVLFLLFELGDFGFELFSRERGTAWNGLDEVGNGVPWIEYRTQVDSRLCKEVETYQVGLRAHRSRSFTSINR